ncbi:MAG TPA: thiamine pyrophosphate-dependent enzyme [Trebonia sp.]|nr:thiamine pyrophosphate-dependent enzyme [Trebonia sp.]
MSRPPAPPGLSGSSEERGAGAREGGAPKAAVSGGSGGSSPRASSDGGEALLQAARDLGCDYLFCSSGSEWAAVWEALARQDRSGAAGPRYLDLAHETLAVAMATGYTTVTGRPQLVLLHAGAGLLQGANAIHGALLAGVGMVVCSAESTGYGDAAGPDPGSQWYRNLSVVGGPQAMAAPFTKWASAAGDVSVLYGMVRRAGELAAQAPAGPVYVNTPAEVLLSRWTPKGGGPVAPAGQSVASDRDIEAAARLLVAARRPVLAVESAGREAAGFAALTELAELLAIPVVEPQSAVCGNFARSSPLHAGGELGPLAREADLVVLVGCRSPWYPPSAKAGDAPVLVIDDTPHRPQMAYQVLTATQYVTGAIAETLPAITARVRSLGVSAEVVAARRAQSQERHAVAEARRVADEDAARSPGPEGTATPEAGLVDPVAVAATLRELIGEDAVVLDETITHSRVIARHLMASVPGRYGYVQGGLGQGLGVALGAKLAHGPGTLVVFTVGDGSWLYNPVVPGLMASAQYGLPLLVVIFNNKKYLSMQFNQAREYPDGVAGRGGEFRYGVDLSDQPDAAAVASAAGAAGFTVAATSQLRATLEKAIETVRGGQAAVVNVLLTR